MMGWFGCGWDIKKQRSFDSSYLSFPALLHLAHFKHQEAEQGVAPDHFWVGRSLDPSRIAIDLWFLFIQHSCLVSLHLCWLKWSARNCDPPTKNYFFPIHVLFPHKVSPCIVSAISGSSKMERPKEHVCLHCCVLKHCGEAPTLPWQEREVDIASLEEEQNCTERPQSICSCLSLFKRLRWALYSAIDFVPT